jgi:iron complex outermembrane receptor protein
MERVMHKKLSFLFFIINFTYAQNLDTLLEEYELNTQKSLKTIDEKLGHVTIYSQKDLRIMQYTTLSDLLKEFPLSNLNTNKLGIPNFSLPGSKTDVSGFFRLFINDHEITSNYTQAPSSSWIDLPVDLIDYIEVYRGNSSFALGSGNGIFFIRIYTKKPSKQNGSQITATIASHGSNSQSFSHADTFGNGWSYLAYFNKSDVNNSTLYKNNKLHNDSSRRYFYLNVQKENTGIDLGFTDIEKDNYIGTAMDAAPDNGKINSKDYFIDLKQYFLNDKSLKLQLSYDRNDLEYEESDGSGLAMIPFIDLSNIPVTIPRSYYQNNSVSKLNAFVSKKINIKDHNLLLGINIQEKRYNTKSNTVTNFANITTQAGRLTNFDKEQVSSILIQDDHKVNENLLLVANGKFDKIKRNGGLDDLSNEQYRFGTIYTPFDNFGIKAFYTKTYISPSFFNIDYALGNIKQQEYKYFTAEGIC